MSNTSIAAVFLCARYLSMRLSASLVHMPIALAVSPSTFVSLLELPPLTRRFVLVARCVHGLSLGRDLLPLAAVV